MSSAHAQGENSAATGTPAISGTAEVGHTLTAGRGTLADTNGLPGSNGYTFQWIRVDGTTETAILGATGRTYRIDRSNQGKNVKVRMPSSTTTDTTNRAQVRRTPRLHPETDGADDPPPHGERLRHGKRNGTRGGFALTLLCAANAQGETARPDDKPSDWYVALSGYHVAPHDSDTSRLTDFGRVSAETQYASSTAFSAAVGTRVTENVRLELEVGYAPVDIEAITNLRVEGQPVSIPYDLTGDSDIWTVTLAATYDFPTEGPVRPYVGAGAGIARHKARTTFTIAGFDPTTESGDDTVWSYHLRAGVGYEASDTAVVFAGYRYTGARDVEIGGARSTSASDALEAGVRIHF